jgi:DNA-binding MarR family transcriptional regulator
MAVNSDAYKVTWLIRRLFRAMADAANDYLRDAGLTAADRAILEFLHPDAELTVPEIARRYQVSRQHVQVTINGLLDKGLVRSTANPQHKRSALMQLTDAGRETFASIRATETRVIDELFSNVEIADVATTKRTLETLLGRLNQEKDHA